MPLPDFDRNGELPQGLYQASIDEIVIRFGGLTSQRRDVTSRLVKIYNLVKATGHLERFIIFGSYVTDKPAPNDVDIFLVMAKEFNLDDQTGETGEVFSHRRADRRFGASIFWVNRETSIADIDDLIAGWQTKRDQTRRGIVEAIL